jgi:hypothetical protein
MMPASIQRLNIHDALYSEGKSQVKFDNGLSHGHPPLSQALADLLIRCNKAQNRQRARIRFCFCVFLRLFAAIPFTSKSAAWAC